MKKGKPRISPKKTPSPGRGKAASRKARSSVPRAPLLKLADLAFALGAVSDLAEGLRLCLESALDVSGQDCGGIYLTDEADGSLRLVHHRGLSAGFIESTARFPADSPNTRLVMTGRPIYSAYRNLEVPKDKVREGEGLRFIAILPFHHRGRVFGCLNVASHARSAISPAARIALEAVAGEIGGAVARLTAEDALRQSEERFRSLFETSQDSIFFIDRETGRILAANPAACRLYGYTVEEFQGMTNRDVSAEPERTRAAVETGAAKVPLRYHRKKDGTVFPVEISGGYFELGGRRLHTAFIRDSSERRRAEEALLQSEERSRLFMENPLTGFGISSGNRVLFANPTLLRIFGYDTLEEFARVPLIDHVAPESRPMIIERIRRQAAGEPIEPLFEYSIIRKDGAMRTLLAATSHQTSGEETHSYTIFQDVTERKRAAEALAESEKRFRALIENSSDAIALIGADGIVLYDSPSHHRLMGYRNEERLGRDTMELLHPDDREKVRTLLAGILRRPARVDLPSVRVRHADGSWRWIEGVANNLLSDPGVGAIVVNFRDITERKKAEDESRESELRYRRLFESAKDGILILEAETGTIVDVNPYLTEMLGFPHGELAGKKIWELGLFKDIAANRENFSTLQREEYIRYENLPLETSDGRRIEVEFVSNVYDVNHRRVIQCNIRDITERRRAAEALKQSETRFRDLAELLPQTVFEMDGDGNVTYINRNGLLALGYTQEDLARGFNISQALVPEDRERARENIVRALTGAGTPGTEYTGLRRDGSTFPILVYSTPVIAAGQTVGLRGLVVDISSQKGMEKALQIANERLKQLLFSSAAAIYTAEASGDYGATSITDNVKDLVGFEASDFLAESSFWIDHIHKDDLKIILDGMPRLLQEGNLSYEYRFLHKNGTYRWIRDDMRLIHDMAGAPREIIGYWIDVTDRKLAEEELRKSLAVEQLASEISAEFVNIRFEKIDEGITRALRKIALSSGAACATLSLFADDLLTVTNTHEWCLHPSDSQFERFPRSHLGLSGHYRDSFEKNRTIVISSPGDFPVADLLPASGLAEIGFRSLIFAPLLRGGRLFGVLGVFGETGREITWPEQLVTLLGFMGDMFGNLLERKQTENELHLYREHLEELVAQRTGELERSRQAALNLMETATVQRQRAEEAEEQIKKSLVEKETLLREIHHRVKNNLNTVSNLIYFQTKLLKDRQALSAFRDSQNRIQSMARIHEHLYRSWDLATVDMKAYLSDLIVDLAQTYGTDRTRLSLEAAPLNLDIDRAVPCGLVINELVSNAIKYAFDAPGPDNLITIRLGAGDGNIVLEVADNGAGLPAAWDSHSVESLGIRLVNMFCAQLKGKLDVSSAPRRGTAFRIVFPAGREEAKP